MHPLAQTRQSRSEYVVAGSAQERRDLLPTPTAMPCAMNEDIRAHRVPSTPACVRDLPMLISQWLSADRRRHGWLSSVLKWTFAAGARDPALLKYADGDQHVVC